MPLLDYPVTRPVILSRWATMSIIATYMVWMVIVTLINVAAVGYELVTLQSPNFNNTDQNWYEKIMPSKSWIPATWACSPSVIKLNEVVFSNLGVVGYTILGYSDVQDGLAVDGLSYSNAALSNCEVAVISLNQFASEAVQQWAAISCNTTAGQNILLQATLSNGVQDATNFDAFPLSLQTTGPNINWTVAHQYYLGIADALLSIIAPPGLPSILLPSIVNNNLTSLQIEFFGNSQKMLKPNTPAGDYWILYVAYSQYQSLDPPETRIPIAFLPTGEIDMTHTSLDDLTIANTLLAPTVGLLREIMDDTNFDFWRFFNWIMVTYYWVLLADLGQIAPTAYDLTTSTPQPVLFPSTNNPFVNETLFQVYFDYFNSTLRPFLEEAYRTLGPPPVLLNDETRLTSTQTTLLRSYTCSWMRIRSPLNLIIQVMAADYALIVGAYTVVRLTTGWWQKRKDDGDLRSTGTDAELHELIGSKEVESIKGGT